MVPATRRARVALFAVAFESRLPGRFWCRALLPVRAATGGGALLLAHTRVVLIDGHLELVDAEAFGQLHGMFRFGVRQQRMVATLTHREAAGGDPYAALGARAFGLRREQAILGHDGGGGRARSEFTRRRPRARVGAGEASFELRDLPLGALTDLLQ